MLKYRNSKKELLNYVTDREEYFRNVDEETYYVIKELLHSEKLLKTVEQKDGEETVDMCKALQDLYDEGIEIGRERGIEEGAEAERLSIAKRMLGTIDVDTIAEMVQLPVEVILRLEEEN